ncbi:MAG: hypothetical protein SGI88_14325 [Candidatus Hydrogenedentes bacterium]|nr:hypothetical protein [Candidatus Hydrogenedentota bacterium]
MDVEIFTLCDFAQNNGGKLVLVGPFDVILSAKAPHVHHACSVALRLRFQKSEEGKHELKLNILDLDGTRIVNELSGELDVKIHPGFLGQAVDIVFQIPNLQLPKFGTYALTLTWDRNHQRSVPFSVIEKKLTE